MVTFSIIEETDCKQISLHSLIRSHPSKYWPVPCLIQDARVSAVV